MSQPMETVYKNSQWMVYEDGDLDCIDGRYWIRAERLLELRMGGGLYSWPIHLAGKNWVDLESFVRAWIAAIKFNEVDVDEDRLAKSIEAGFKKVKRNLDYISDRFVYDLERGVLLKDRERPADPLEALKECTVSLSDEQAFTDWQQKTMGEG